MTLPTDLFKIYSFNCNGLNDSKKRKDVFDYIRSKKDFQIVCLQETHWPAETEAVIRASWGYNVWLSGEDTNRNGVAILFNNNFEYKVFDVILDPHGCFIAMSLEILRKKITLINLYGPSSGDKPDFFQKVVDCLEQFDNDSIIITGDWNCVLDTNLDVRNYASTENRPRTRKKINDIMSKYDLIDIYRETHPNRRLYTWRRFNTIKQARLDYFLVSSDITSEVTDSFIEPGYRSDHSFVALALRKERFKRDRPFWKMNNSLLRDKEYILQIKEVIQQVKKRYALLIYNLDNIDNIANNSLSFTISDQLFFETLLMEIRGKTISYATFRKKQLCKQEQDLEKND